MAEIAAGRFLSGDRHSPRPEVRERRRPRDKENPRPAPRIGARDDGPKGFHEVPARVLAARRDRRPCEKLLRFSSARRRIQAHSPLRRAFGPPDAGQRTQQTAPAKGDDGDGARRQEPALCLEQYPAAALARNREALRHRRHGRTRSRGRGSDSGSNRQSVLNPTSEISGRHFRQHPRRREGGG